MGLDVMATLGAGAAPRGSTAPGRVRFAHGGVGRNIAEALAALGCDAAMVGAVGRDDAGGALLAALEARGVRTRAVRRVEGARTQVVACVFGVNGDLHVGVADTAITEAGVSAEWVRSTASHALEGAAWVVLDANLDADALLAAADAAASTGAKLWLEPVSVAKAARVVPALGVAAAVSPNAAELAVLTEAVGGAAQASELRDALLRAGGDHRAPVAAVAAAANVLLGAGVQVVLTTLGSRGALLSSREAASCEGGARRASVSHVHVGVAPDVRVANVSGAGDCQVAAIIASLAAGAPLGEAARRGAAAAALAVESAAHDSRAMVRTLRLRTAAAATPLALACVLAAMLASALGGSKFGVRVAEAKPGMRIGNVDDVVLPEEVEERAQARKKFEESGAKQLMMFVRLAQKQEDGSKALAKRFTDMLRAGGLNVGMYAIDDSLMMATTTEVGRSKIEEAQEFFLSRDEVESLELDSKTITRDDIERRKKQRAGGMANGGDLDQLLATLKGDGVVGDNFGIGDLQAAARKGMSGMGGGMAGDLEKAAKKEATKQHETRRRRRRQEKREAEKANRAAEATARGEL
eukprot:PRCOL_00000481-RA